MEVLHAAAAITGRASDGADAELTAATIRPAVFWTFLDVYKGPS
jgi:hypothetical protein